MRIECSGALQDYDAMTVRLCKPSLRHSGRLGAPRHRPGRHAGGQPG
jgi:hypothetical protein